MWDLCNIDDIELATHNPNWSPIYTSYLIYVDHFIDVGAFTLK